jgi:hypothetical protein
MIPARRYGRASSQRDRYLDLPKAALILMARAAGAACGRAGPALSTSSSRGSREALGLPLRNTAPCGGDRRSEKDPKLCR